MNTKYFKKFFLVLIFVCGATFITIIINNNELIKDNKINKLLNYEERILLEERIKLDEI
jgi:hypothetical protein